MCGCVEGKLDDTHSNSIIGEQLLAGYIAANLYIDSDRLQPQSVFRQVHV